MIDVFNEEIEVLIKEGISNLYWYRADLRKAWLRSGIDLKLANIIYEQKDIDGKNLTKRQLMDVLYDHLRDADFNRRLEVSRNFVRILVEHQNFVLQNEKHRIDKAERSALKLREVIHQQNRDKEYRDSIRYRAQTAKQETYDTQLLKLREEFLQYNDLSPQKRGYALETLFQKLMTISGIPVQAPFKIEGEQIDGGIKYDGHYYLIELKWKGEQSGPSDMGSFYFKVDGKFEQRGILISMSGFTEGVINSLPKGKELKVLLLDGVHLSNVIFGIYTFQELLEHSLSYAAYKAELYCPHTIVN